MKPLTLQEARDIAAKIHGYKDYASAAYDLSLDDDLVEMKILNEADQIFGDSQWNAALEKAAEIAVDTSFESLSEFNNFLEELKKLKR